MVDALGCVVPVRDGQAAKNAWVRGGRDLARVVAAGRQVVVGEQPGVAEDRFEAQTFAHLDADALAEEILRRRSVENKIHDGVDGVDGLGLVFLIMVTMIVLIQPTLHGSEMRCLNLSSAPQICSSDSNGISPHT